MQRYSLRYLAFFSSLAFVIWLALLSMGGWFLHNLDWIQISPAFRTMKFNTALGFLCSAGALIALINGKNRLAIIMASVVTAIGGITFVEYVLGVNFGIDTLFVNPFTAVGQMYAYPGRMVPGAALAFLLLGSSLVRCAVLPVTEYSRVTVASAACFVIAIGAIPVTEFITGASYEFMWGNLTEMAVHSAVCFLLMGGCTLGYVWKNARGLWLPIPVCVCLLSITTLLGASLYRSEDKAFDAMVQSEAERFSSVLETRFTELYNALDRISERWEAAGGTPKSLWLADTTAYLKDYNYIVAIEWLDSDLRVQWVQPLSGNEQLIGRKLNFENRRLFAIQQAIATERPTIADGIELLQGGKGLLYYRPLYIKRGDKKVFDGVMVAGIRLDPFFKPLLERRSANFYVDISNGDIPIFSTLLSPTAPGLAWQKSSVIKNSNKQWKTSLIPTPHLLSTRNSVVPLTVLIAGSITSVLISLCLFMALRWRFNSHTLEDLSRLNKAILYHSAVMIIATDPEGRIIAFNRTAEKMLGYTLAELEGKLTPPQWLDPEEIKRRASELSLELGTAIRPTFEVFTFKPRLFGVETTEWNFIHKNGHRIPVQLVVTVLKDTQNNITGYLGIAEDITRRKMVEQERKAAEEKLRLSEEKYRLLVNGIRDYAICWLDGDGNVSSWNTGAENLQGYEEQEIIGRHYSVFFTEEERSSGLPADILNRTIKMGKYGADGWRVRKDGTKFWAHVLMEPIYSIDKNVIGYVMVCHDETQRKTADEALRTSEETFRSAMDSAATGMALAKPNGRWMKVNPALCELLGYTEEELLTKDFQSITHPDDLALDLKQAADLLSGKISHYHMEKRYFHKDGNIVWILLSVSLVRTQQNNPAYFIAQMQDITTLKSSEAVQQALIDKLITSNTELERFAYVASHDMQEPLRMIANFSGIIKDEYEDKLDETGKEYLAVVMQSALRMQKMVSDLLEYARVGKDAMPPIDIDMAEEIKHVLYNLAASIYERKAKVTHGNLPHVTGNPIHLSRLLQNLISNGLKYQAENTVPKVHIDATDEGNCWKFSVKDNGIGMEPAHAVKIFEPFVRLHTWQQYNGTGIGLAVCKKIVENHGGKIWVDSEPGKGSVFYFTIPKRDTLKMTARNK